MHDNDPSAHPDFLPSDRQESTNPQSWISGVDQENVGYYYARSVRKSIEMAFGSLDRHDQQGQLLLGVVIRKKGATDDHAEIWYYDHEEADFKCVKATPSTSEGNDGYTLTIGDSLPIMSTDGYPSEEVEVVYFEINKDIEPWEGDTVGQMIADGRNELLRARTQ